MNRLLRLSSAVLISAAATGCAHAPLWSKNGALKIVAPRELALTGVPVTLRWKTSALPGHTTYFAVFIDRAPVEPGQSLRAVGSSDASCRRTPGCPDATYLRAHDVFLTSANQVTIPYLATLGGIAGRDHPPVHRATIILVNAQGERLGEYAYSVEFRVTSVGA